MVSMLDLPVADPWFVVERVDDGVTLVAEPHVHPLLRCNVWHVRGRDLDLVVDTSLGLRPLRHLVEPVGRAHVLAVATHVHADHVGGMHEFDDAGDPPVGGRAARRRPASVDTRHRRVFGDAVCQPYLDAGYDIPDLLDRRRPGRRAAAGTLERRRRRRHGVLDDGDVIDLGDRAFEVLHLPGHSPGSIGLWEPATGVLFSGDAIYDGPLLDELDGCDIGDYVATMQPPAGAAGHRRRTAATSRASAATGSSSCATSTSPAAPDAASPPPGGRESDALPALTAPTEPRWARFLLSCRLEAQRCRRRWRRPPSQWARS